MVKMIKDFMTKWTIGARVNLLCALAITDYYCERSFHAFTDFLYWPDGICADTLWIMYFFMCCLIVVLADLWTVSQRIYQNRDNITGTIFNLE